MANTAIIEEQWLKAYKQLTQQVCYLRQKVNSIWKFLSYGNYENKWY